MAGRRFGIGLVGTGYLGKAFALGYRSAPVIFGPEIGAPELVVVAASTPERGPAEAAALGFARAAADWRAVVDDPDVDIVVVNTPNHLHAPVALAAIAAGKPVHCEKPLGLTGAEALVLLGAARAAGTPTMVGFNYRQNPACTLAREIIAGGELGKVYSVRGTHCEDWAADPRGPLGWKSRRATAGYGALGDVGSHITCILEYLLGPIARVNGMVRTVHPRRPVAAGSAEMIDIETDDEARFLVEFASGVAGSVEASRVAVGRQMALTYEITGTRGALYFTQERMSELQLYQWDGHSRARAGFRTLLLGPEHPDYGRFSQGPGHGLGFNDQKIIECARFLQALRDATRPSPDFADAAHVNLVLDAVLASSAGGGWVAVPDIGLFGSSP
jgi:predicted dehydrogenase